MAIASWSAYVAKVAAPFRHTRDFKNTITTVASRHYSLWRAGPDTGAIPTTPEVPTKDTVGAMPLSDSDGVQRLARYSGSNSVGAYVLLCDRLSHQGGLSGTDATTQTTNLPTAALTRYTDGIGVMAALEIYTTVGTTGTTATVAYTSATQSPSDMVSPATPFGATGFNVAGRFIILPLAEGDVGLRSVESVTLAGTTGTTGNFGVTLFKPLAAFPAPGFGSQQFLQDSIIGGAGNMPQIINGACLFYVVVSSTTASGVINNVMQFIEE